MLEIAPKIALKRQVFLLAGSAAHRDMFLENDKNKMPDASTKYLYTNNHWCCAGARWDLFWVFTGASRFFCFFLFWCFWSSCLKTNLLKNRNVTHLNQEENYKLWKKHRGMTLGNGSKWKERKEWKTSVKKKPNGRKLGWEIPTSTPSCSSTMKSTRWWVVCNQRYFKKMKMKKKYLLLS